jgi:hypothetical protein
LCSTLSKQRFTFTAVTQYKPHPPSPRLLLQSCDWSPCFYPVPVVLSVLNRVAKMIVLKCESMSLLCLSLPVTPCFSVSHNLGNGLKGSTCCSPIPHAACYLSCFFLNSFPLYWRWLLSPLQVLLQRQDLLSEACSEHWAQHCSSFLLTWCCKFTLPGLLFSVFLSSPSPLPL